MHVDLNSFFVYITKHAKTPGLPALAQGTQP
jgi:hypothetical protein